LAVYLTSEERPIVVVGLRRRRRRSVLRRPTNS